MRIRWDEPKRQEVLKRRSINLAQLDELFLLPYVEDQRNDDPEEYSEHGVHVANVIIDGLIDSPGTRALPRAQQQPEVVMNPVKIAEAFYYLHTQDKSCWTHELQLTPYPTKPSF